MTISFLLSLLFAAVSLGLHARRLPPQNLFAIALLISASAALAEWCSRTLGLPFTPLHLKEAGLYCLPLGWIGTLLLSRKIGQTFLRSLRGRPNYGLFLLVFTICLTTSLWTVLEVVRDMFNPLNIPGRIVTSGVILLIIFPWLIEKRPRISP